NVAVVSGAGEAGTSPGKLLVGARWEMRALLGRYPAIALPLLRARRGGGVLAPIPGEPAVVLQGLPPPGNTSPRSPVPPPSLPPAAPTVDDRPPCVGAGAGPVGRAPGVARGGPGAGTVGVGAVVGCGRARARRRRSPPRLGPVPRAARRRPRPAGRRDVRGG